MIDHYVTSKILGYLNDVCYKINFFNTCSNYYKLSGIISDEIKKKKKFIDTFFPRQIQSIFLNKLIMFPQLKWKDTFLGSTGYIDQFNIKDLDNNIMIGVDNAQRPFIVLVHQSKLDPDSDFYSSGYTIDVLFQRYTSDKYSWSNSHKGATNLINYSGYFYNRGILNDNLVTYNVESLIKNYGILKSNLYNFETHKNDIVEHTVNLVSNRQLLKGAY